MSEVERWLDQQAARVLEVGSTCALGGDATWDALLKELAVEPLPPDERRRHLAEGPKRTRGALPIEVRWAITAVQDRAKRAPHEDALDHKLHTIIDVVTREHLARTAPAAATTASIFANARATTPSYGGGVAAGMNQTKCAACGGPRKTEALVCAYCGGKL